MNETVKFTRDGAVAMLTVSRPEALNALNSQVLTELGAHARSLAEMRDVQVVVITGEGEKAFVAGADIKEMLAFTSEEAARFGRVGAQAFAALARLPQIVIAKVNGFALGGGLELALAADFIYASAKARFGLPEVMLGLIPGFGGTQRLADRIGVARALEWVTGADKYDANEALAAGLVNRVVAPEELNDAVNTLARRIAANGPGAVRSAKAVVTASRRTDAGVGFELESAQFGLRFGTAEAKEGLAAFVEKRAAKFPAL